MKKGIFVLLFLGIIVSCGKEKNKVTQPELKTETKIETSKNEEKIQWMTMNEALEAQKKNPKKIFVHFFTQWCPMCKRMESDTYAHPTIIKYLNENYYAVKFDAEGGETVNYQGKTYTNPTYNPNAEIKYGGNGSYNEFAALMGVRGFPTVVFFDEAGQGITNFSGYMKPKEIDPFLTVIATNEYKNIKNQNEWEAYLKKFEYKIKE